MLASVPILRLRPLFIVDVMRVEHEFLYVGLPLCMDALNMCEEVEELRTERTGGDEKSMTF